MSTTFPDLTQVTDAGSLGNQMEVPPFPGSPAPVTPPTPNTVPQPATPNTIAQNTLVANKLNPGDWAGNMVAGVMAALSGIPTTPAPVGAGISSGIGKAAQAFQERKQQKLQNQMAQEKLSIEQQENARQQAKSIADAAEHDLRMKTLTTDASVKNLELASSEHRFRQSQLDQEDALQRIGAKPLQIMGKETPAFEHLGEAEQYAKDNNLIGHQFDNGHRARIVLGGDDKYHIYEVPDEGIKEYVMKDADGNEVRITTDPLGALNYQEKVSQIKHQSAEAEELAARAAKERMDAGTGNAADALAVFDNAYQAMKADPEFQNLPRNDANAVDTNSEEYQKLDHKYGVSSSYEAAKKLGIGYSSPTEETARLLVSGDFSRFTDLTGRASPQQKQQLFHAVHNEAIRQGKDPNDFSPGALTAKADMYEDYHSNKKGSTGASITSFNTFLEHAKDALDASDEWGRTNSPLLNKPWGWIEKNAANDPNYIKFKTSLLAPAEEFITFLKGNFAPTTDELAQMNEILSKDSTPLAIATAFKQLANSADIRLRNIGATYQKNMGNNTNWMTPAASKALQALRPTTPANIPPNPNVGVPKGAVATQQDAAGNTYYIDEKGNILGLKPPGAK